MPVQDIQKVLPSLKEPSDDDVAHITNKHLNFEVAYCGCRKAGGHGAHGDLNFAAGKCSCGTPLCPACLQVRSSYVNTGGWEGPAWR